MVLANSLQLGTIDALGDSSAVPFFKRYFLGGATSIRGWGRFEVSPLSGFGLPIGGLSMFEGSTEIRKPLFGKLGAVGFFDFGNVPKGEGLAIHPYRSILERSHEIIGSVH